MLKTVGWLMVIATVALLIGNGYCQSSATSTTKVRKNHEISTRDHSDVHGAPQPGSHGDEHDNKIQGVDTANQTPGNDATHGCHSNTEEGCTMDMTFTLSRRVVILFTFWETSSLLELAISCAVVFFLAIVNECLRFFQTQLHSRHLEYLTRTNQQVGATTPSLASYGTVQSSNCDLEERNNKRKGEPNRCAAVCVSIAYSIHYMLKETLGVMIMLILMTFNVWIIFSVVLGSGVGYVVTSHMTSWRRRCQKNKMIRLEE